MTRPSQDMDARSAGAEFDIRGLNVALNHKEFEEGKEELSSTPRLVTLGANNVCNAKCIFCPHGEDARFTPRLYRDSFEAKLGHFIRRAEKVTFTGSGEVLLAPEIEKFLDYINETLPETEKIFTTNGTPLRRSVVERLLQGRYSIRISLHASNADLHGRLTRLTGQFDRIIANIRDLISLRDAAQRGRELHVELVDVLTTYNIADLPDFLRLAWDLGAQSVSCSYVTMFVPEHVALSPYFIQEEANRWVTQAQETARLLQARDPDRPFAIGLPPLFGAAVATQTTRCYDPWQQIYVEHTGAVLPCCFWGEHIGHLAKGDEIDQIWNDSFYRKLRHAMASGVPHPWCRLCMRCAGYNVNNIETHITNRPAAQRLVLEEARRLRREPRTEPKT